MLCSCFLVSIVITRPSSSILAVAILLAAHFFFVLAVATSLDACGSFGLVAALLVAPGSSILVLVALTYCS